MADHPVTAFDATHDCDGGRGGLSAGGADRPGCCQAMLAVVRNNSAMSRSARSRSRSKSARLPAGHRFQLEQHRVQPPNSRIERGGDRVVTGR